MILRCVLHDRSAQALHEIEFTGVRGDMELKEVTVQICGRASFCRCPVLMQYLSMLCPRCYSIWK